MYVKTLRRQRGMSLVEVFVALLVLSVGLIALAKLQVDLVRGSSDARTRTVALALAEEKVEDLRTFAVADDSGTWSTTANPMAWSYIGGPPISTPPETDCDPTPCEGGRIAPQTTYSSALEVAGVRFRRTWEVTSRDFTGTGPITTRTKNVRVTVAWQNELGVEQQVSSFANLVEFPPGNVALASEPVTDRPDGPQIAYNPGEAPEVISVPIETGTGGQKRETSKPLPDVQAQGDYAHEVSFDVVNYHDVGDENFVVDRREEFVTVNCRCALAGANRGRTPARVTFTGNILRDQPGEVITSKSQTGIVLTSGANSVSQQPVLCSICCRDHHDGPVDGSDYNRYKATDNVPSGQDHRHYLWNSSTNTFTEATATGNAYDEACRLKRVNGVFQVFQDWNLVSIFAMPESDLNDTTIAGDYRDFVQDNVKHAANNTLPTGTAPTLSTTTLVPAGSKQLSGRAVFIDQMPQNLIDFLNTDPPPADLLKYVPFYEVNLSKLANWKLQTISPDGDYATVDGQTCGPTVTQAALTTPTQKSACVANQAIVDETVFDVGVLQNYFRGLLTGGPLAGQLDAQVHAINGNTSVTGTFALTAAQASSTPVSSEYRFSVDAGQAVGGKVCIGANAPNGNNWSDISVSASGVGSCTLSPTTGNPTAKAINCSVPSGWTGTVTASWAGGGSHTFAPANDTFPPNTLGPSQLPVTFILDPGVGAVCN